MIKIVRKILVVLFVSGLFVSGLFVTLVATIGQFIQQPLNWPTQQQLLIVSCLLALLLRIYLSHHPSFLKTATRQKLNQLGHFFIDFNFISVTGLAILMFVTSLLNPTEIISNFYQPAMMLSLNWLIIWQLIANPTLERWLQKYSHWWH